MMESKYIDQVYQINFNNSNLKSFRNFSLPYLEQFIQYKFIHNGQQKKFLQTLYQIIENKDYETIIQWSQNGKAILLISPHVFAETILPYYFNTMKIKSFYRQLSIYGFSVKQNNKKEKQFEHQLFFRGNYKSLNQIQRMNKRTFETKFKTESVQELRLQTQDLMRTLDHLSKQQQIMFQQFRKHAEFQTLIFNSIQTLHKKVREQCGQNEKYHCEDFLNFMVKIFKGFQNDIAEVIFDNLDVFGGPDTPNISPSPLLFQHQKFM